MAPTVVRTAAVAVALLLPGALAQFHEELGAYNMRDALLTEARAERLKQRDYRLTFNAEVTEGNNARRDKKRIEYEERGSEFYEDGVTPIPGNESPGSKPIDPRVPKGFKNPFWQKIHAEQNNEVSTSPFEDEALESVTADSVDFGWIYITGWGLQVQGGQKEAEFDTLLSTAPNKIIRRTCYGCAATHQEIFYKRIASVPATMLDILKSNWVAAENELGIHFNLYSSYEDAVNNQNAWTFCDYDQDHGFPGNCGPDGQVEDQWSRYQPRQGQPDVAFFVESSAATADEFQFSDLEVMYEAELRADPEGAKERGPCWRIPILDERRACWRACSYALTAPTLETIKLCNNLRAVGQTWANELDALERDILDVGLERGGKIKSTHPLGNDDGLPSMGTF